MKKLFYLFLLIFMFPCVQTYGIIKDAAVLLHTVTPKEKDYEPDHGDTGKRDNMSPIYCVISEEGIEFDVPIFGITSYEIWDDEFTCCLYEDNKERDFINFLFTLSGTYNIRFVTYDCAYEGTINL